MEKKELEYAWVGNLDNKHRNAPTKETQSTKKITIIKCRPGVVVQQIEIGNLFYCDVVAFKSYMYW